MMTARRRSLRVAGALPFATLASQGVNIAILAVWGAVTFGLGLKLFRWQ